MMCVLIQVGQFRLRAVRPKHDAPKETTPRTKETLDTASALIVFNL